MTALRSRALANAIEFSPVQTLVLLCVLLPPACGWADSDRLRPGFEISRVDSAVGRLVAVDCTLNEGDVVPGLVVVYPEAAFSTEEEVPAVGFKHGFLVRTSRGEFLVDEGVAFVHGDGSVQIVAKTIPDSSMETNKTRVRFAIASAEAMLPLEVH